MDVQLVYHFLRSKDVELGNKKTLEYYTYILHKIPIDPRKCTIIEIENWIQSMREKLSANSIRTRYAIFRSLCTYLFKRGQITADLYQRLKVIPIPKKVSPTRKPITLEEEQAIFKKLTKLRYKVAFSIALDTFLRVSEIIQIKWKYVHIDEKSPQNSFIDATKLSLKGKMGSEVECPYKPITTQTIDFLHEYIKEKGENKYLFPSGSRNSSQPYMNRWNLTTALKIAAKKAGIKRNIYSHLCRHTAASRLMDAGVDSEVIRRLGNWSSKEMLKTYAHMDKMKVVENINRVRSSEVEEEHV